MGYFKLISVLIFILILLVWAISANASDVSMYSIQKKGEIETLAKWIKSNYLKDSAKANSLAEHIHVSASKYGVDPFLIAGVIANESSFKANAVNESARGLMGVIPSWHKKIVKGRNLLDPKVGIDAGVAVLKEYIDSNNGNIKQALSNYRGLPYTQCAKYVAKIESSKRKLFAMYESKYSVMDSDRENNRNFEKLIENLALN
jgi:soluble lytic murein transglycosylase-like protein